MTTLYRCPSVKSNRVVSREAILQEVGKWGNLDVCIGRLHDWESSDGFAWYSSEQEAIEVNRMKRNKLIARKAREIQKLSEVY